MATYQFSGIGRIDCCAECPFCQSDWDGMRCSHHYYCDLSDNKLDDVEVKPNDCPLVLISENDHKETALNWE